MGDQVTVGNSMFIGRATRQKAALQEFQTEVEKSDKSGWTSYGSGLRKAYEIFSKHGLLNDT